LGIKKNHILLKNKTEEIDYKMATATIPQYQTPWCTDILNTLQHQGIVNSVDNNAGDIIQQVTAVDKHLSDGVLQLSNGIGTSTSKMVDMVGAQALGIRDAVERTATNLSTQNASGIRDTQVAVERNGSGGINTTERVGSTILFTVERSAGETRLSNAVSDAANRQGVNDLARDIINQTNRDSTNIQKSISDLQYTALVTDVANRQNTNDLSRDIINQTNRDSSDIQRSISEIRYNSALTDAAGRQASNDIARDIMSRINDTSTSTVLSIEKNGYANQLLQNANSYEVRTLLNDRSNSFIQELGKSTERQMTQGLLNYSSLLLEQQKSREANARDLADAKYEALRNKEALSGQIAMGFCETKFEALKNTQAITSQLEECCCNLKSRISEVSTRIDDTVRTLDANRLRDSLNTANNEINLLKIAEHTRNNYYGNIRG
jgi:hypothetical protein